VTEKKRRTGVQRADYVTHLQDGDRTLCNRVAALYNCQVEGEPVTEGTCIVCAGVKRSREKKTDSAIAVLRAVAKGEVP
jgi:hypothetical protein